jgi:hypothetical protein
MQQQEAYPVRFTVDYPNRPLDRLTTGFRVLVTIPNLIVLAAVAGGEPGSRVPATRRPRPPPAGAVLRAVAAAQELDPHRLQGAVVQVMAAALAGHQQVGTQPSCW